MSERGHTGRLLGGRFELMARLGSGGMGTVWRARDLSLHREVAIKEVRPADAALYEHSPALAAQQRERVLRESRALARLQHPNVVSIYQILDADGSPYPWIVMELVRGTSLEERLRRGPLTPRDAARIGRGVLGALRAAHAAGIHHRDVKPGNVLLRPDGSAVLTDFGIAALRDSTTLTATGEVIGSPEYIAPERLHGDETRTASDLWSLGMLLYVAVEGYHPMRRTSMVATLAAVMTEPVPPPRRAGPLAAALSTVLVADPAARPDGEQLDRMLAAAEAGVAPPAHATPPPFQQPFQQPAYDSRPALPTPVPAPRRGRVAAWAGVVSVAAAVVVAAIVLALTRPWGQEAGDGSAAGGSSGTRIASAPNVTVPGVSVPGVTVPGVTVPGGPTTGGDAPADLLTPDGARTVVAAFRDAMGGTKVADITIYPDYATATAPTDAVKNGFDNYEYRAGIATRTGADGVSDQAVLDLDSVNWDALPALWKRAEKELGVDEPTLRYLIVETSIITGEPATMNLYLADDYSGAYLKASLDGKVIELYGRGG
jgi:serine/threonine protein kinase